MICCLQGRWKSAMQFFALSEQRYLHPCQLLASIIPTLLMAGTSATDTADISALRDAARASLQELVSSQVPEQSADVSLLFMELLDAQPDPLLVKLVECRRSRRLLLKGISSLVCPTSYLQPRSSWRTVFPPQNAPTGFIKTLMHT
jgi:hypothetical protein